MKRIVVLVLSVENSAVQKDYVVTLSTSVKLSAEEILQRVMGVVGTFHPISQTYWSGLLLIQAKWATSELRVDHIRSALSDVGDYSISLPAEIC